MPTMTLMPAENQRFPMSYGPSADQDHHITASLGSNVGLAGIRLCRSLAAPATDRY